MLLGFSDEATRRICVEERSARKALPQSVANALRQKLSQLAAYDRLSDVPIGTPTFRHALVANWAGHYAVNADKKYRIIFKPAGVFASLPDGTPDLRTVTSIEIVAIRDYH